ATMWVRAADPAASPNTSVASSDNRLRSWPTMPPTRALTPTRRQNWARLAPNPRRRPPGRARAVGARPRRRASGGGPAPPGPPPVPRAAMDDPQLLVTGAFQEAGRGHGPLA